MSYHRQWSARLAYAAGGAAIASVVMFGLYYTGVRRAAHAQPESVAAARIDPSVGAALRAPVHAAVAAYLDAPVTLKFDGRTLATTWKALGLTVDEAGVAREAARLAAGGATGIREDRYLAGNAGLVPVALDRAAGLEALVAYKESYDRLPVDARLDLDRREVISDRPGYGMNVYESLALVEEAARADRTEVELAGHAIEPGLTRAKLGDIDISHVLGWFETKFPVGEKLRNYNLKLGAEKVNGTILMPGQEFSFNAVVGPRTEKEGYRVAHVISAGEMIDGLAGGSCQVSSTLHGAAFFAGLDILHSSPHSRPSTYITMGLDATVVYPSSDLELRNSYDFPVVLKYTVSQGTMRVEILGKQRPYDKVEFEREIVEETPFETITREDDRLPVGSTVPEQLGFPGYKLTRRRNFYRDGKVVKTERWTLRYPPTTEYVRIGTNIDPNLPPPPPPKKSHGIRPPEGKKFHLSQ